VAATAEQAGEHPNYREGAQGYAERYGAVYNGAPEPNYSTRGAAAWPRRQLQTPGIHPRIAEQGWSSAIS
jgi:hypothetical protein